MEYLILGVVLILVGFFFLAALIISFYVFVLGLIGLGLLLIILGCAGLIGGDPVGGFLLLAGILLTVLGVGIASFLGGSGKTRRVR